MSTFKARMTSIEELLAQKRQTSLLEHLDNLAGQAKESLHEQLGLITWEELEIEAQSPKLGSLTTLPVSKYDSSLSSVGEGLYREGKVGVLLLAGGAGTRLGVDGPKGCVIVDQAASRWYTRLPEVRQSITDARVG